MIPNWRETFASQIPALYRVRQIHKPQVLWKWSEKVAFFCLLQAGERNFLFSYSRNLGFVDLPIPVEHNVGLSKATFTCVNNMLLGSGTVSQSFGLHWDERRYHSTKHYIIQSDETGKLCPLVLQLFSYNNHWIFLSFIVHQTQALAHQ